MSDVDKLSDETRRQKEAEAIQSKSHKLKELRVEYVPIDRLKPNWYNPNRQSEHEFELLTKSMQEDGFTQPVVALKDGTIVDGEHRWRAAQVIGYKDIPVVFVDMSPEQMRISTLRHNRARGKEDTTLVARVIKDLAEIGAADWAKDSLMLSDQEFAAAIAESAKDPGVHATVADMLESEEAGRVSETKRSTDDYIGSTEGVKVFTKRDEVTGQEVASSLSLAASDLLRKKRVDAQAEHDEEYAAQEDEDAKISTYIFVYADEEAKIVRGALGDTPAVKAVELCKAEHERRQSAHV